MRTIKMGAIKFKSIKAAVEAARKRNPSLSYMTCYMRIRANKPIGSALQAKPRRYKRVASEPIVA